jgi:catechol-2,3-dioxygenase
MPAPPRHRCCPLRLSLGAVHLAVSNPDLPIIFYEEAIGEQDARKQESRRADSNR